MSYEYYQQVIIAQEYFPSFNAMAITNHSKQPVHWRYCLP